MSTSTIDPRIRARRIAVQRDEGRKRLRRLGLVSSVAAVGAGLWGITLTPVLDVDHVAVVGATRSGVEAVQAATGIARGDALLTAHLGRAASRVADLPWVQTVEVHRHWPGTVRVEVVERTAVAAAPVQAGGWVLLDAEGRQLAVTPDPGPGILHVEVPPVVPSLGHPLAAGADAVLRLAATRPLSLQDRLLALKPGPAGTVDGTVKLPTGATAVVRFGQPTQAPAKWLALLSILQDADPARITTIDVRVPSAPALTRR
ncbi:MAG: cell division protein [Actinomycetia bacterium]|nr:cell division protein [Actinomycetes bacterium]